MPVVTGTGLSPLRDAALELLGELGAIGFFDGKPEGLAEGLLLTGMARGILLTLAGSEWAVGALVSAGAHPRPIAERVADCRAWIAAHPLTPEEADDAG